MDQIMAYRRANGDIGVRNHLAVIPSVFCANHVAKQIAAQLANAIAFPHPTGCGQHGKDLEQSYDTLAGLGQNGNFGAVIVVGLGCELSTRPNWPPASRRPESLWNISTSRKSAAR